VAAAGSEAHDRGGNRQINAKSGHPADSLKQGVSSPARTISCSSDVTDEANQNSSLKAKVVSRSDAECPAQ
jgi:hypothetical protein